MHLIMDHMQVFIAVLSLLAICFQVGATRRRAEENVCCESTWNSTDIRGGCCGQGWGIHCCYTSSIPQTRDKKVLFIRIETCCDGEERVPVPSDRLHNHLYKGIVLLNAIVFAAAVVLTAIMLLGCCRSFRGFWSSPSGYPVKRLLNGQPNRYGAVLETWPNGRGYTTTDPFRFTPYPGRAQPHHQTTSRSNYLPPPPSYNQHQPQKAHPAY